MDRAAEIRRLEQLATWLDRRFPIPGTSLRFGLDSIVGLLPFVGDGVTLVPALYIVLRAHRMGMPWHGLAVMLLNVGIDALIGAIPLVGDLFDFGFKANWRNVELIKRHLGRPHSAGPG